MVQTKKRFQISLLKTTFLNVMKFLQQFMKNPVSIKGDGWC